MKKVQNAKKSEIEVKLDLLNFSWYEKPYTVNTGV